MKKTCQKPWDTIPERHRTGHCFMDCWDAYQKVISAEQHTVCGKDSRLTAHVERWNNTLRQWLARLVRKTLSFSKSDELHRICLLPFLYRYNLSLPSPN